MGCERVVNKRAALHVISFFLSWLACFGSSAGNVTVSTFSELRYANVDGAAILVVQDIVFREKVYINGTVSISSAVRATLHGGNGLFYVNASCRLSLLNLVLWGNGKACPKGGAVFAAPGATVALDRVVMRDLSADLGGAIAMTDATLSVSRSTFLDNSAQSAGGVLYATGSAIWVSESSFSGNSCNESTSGPCFGGAVASDFSVVALSNSIMNGNTATSGGAIATFRGTLKIHRSIFSSNSAKVDGGALLIYSAEAVIADASFEDNVAEKEGSDIFVENLPPATTRVVCTQQGKPSIPNEIFGSLFEGAIQGLEFRCFPCSAGAYGDAPQLDKNVSCAGMCSKYSNSSADAQCVRCPYEAACTGGRDCATGYKGLLCGQCELEFYRYGLYQCEPCSSHPWRAALTLALLAAFVFLFYKAKNKLSSHSLVQLTIRLRILVGFVSVLALIAYIPVPFSAALRNILRVPSLIVDFTDHLPQPECIVGSYRWFDKVLTIIFGSAMFFAAGAGVDRRFSRSLNEAPSTAEWERVYRGRQQLRRIVAQFALVAWYPLILMSASVFVCSEFDGQQLLAFDTAQRCFDASWWPMALFCGSLLLILGLGWPALILFAARKRSGIIPAKPVIREAFNRHACHEKGEITNGNALRAALAESGFAGQGEAANAMFKRFDSDYSGSINLQEFKMMVGAVLSAEDMTSILQEPYRDGAAWFEIVILFRRSILLLASIAIKGGLKQAGTMMFVNGIYMAVVIFLNPYEFASLQLGRAVFVSKIVI